MAGGAARPVIGRSFALADAPAAFRELHSEHARGKLVIAVSASPSLTREVTT